MYSAMFIFVNLQLFTLTFLHIEVKTTKKKRQQIGFNKKLCNWQVRLAHLEKQDGTPAT